MVTTILYYIAYAAISGIVIIGLGSFLVKFTIDGFKEYILGQDTNTNNE